ncbi:MAG: hypothetical protein M3373_12660 [Gemmatimonadota bacterium]|nr:hypothetical protein [Gemmatimonadota bacterium]
MRASSATVTDPTLLLPGTQASRLDDGAGVTVFNAIRVALGLSDRDLGGRPPAQFGALLGMKHAPGQWEPVHTSLAPNTTLSAGKVVATPYDRLSRIARPFPYDWRADIRWNALRLLDFLRGNPPPPPSRPSMEPRRPLAGGTCRRRREQAGRWA